MPEWEYRKIDLNALPRNSSEVDLLNIVGDDGWELVIITLNNIRLLQAADPKAALKAQNLSCFAGTIIRPFYPSSN